MGGVEDEDDDDEEEDASFPSVLPFSLLLLLDDDCALMNVFLVVGLFPFPRLLRKLR